MRSSPGSANSNFSREPATAARNGTKPPAPHGSAWPEPPTPPPTAPSAASTALAKLRIAVAFGERETPAQPPERFECALGHAGYPLWLAHILDVAAEEKWELKAVAAKIGCTPSSLVKKLARDPALWQFANAERTRLELPPLRRP